MATLESSPPSSPNRRRPKRWARRVERCCCNALTYFPLLFVYSLTSWAAWVEASIGFLPSSRLWTGYGSSFLGVALFLLLNASYTTAVFTDPGSPNAQHGGYGQLPTDERGHSYTSFTVKSSGDIRYCKKCQCKKPDRAHHCSTCRRCVLKMDHHCPWLATCVGLRNYKPFLLFLIYTCAFCWLCFTVTATWLWAEVLSDSQFEETLMPVNFILLAVLSGIIGLVLTGFTAWHIWLACKGRTTIESLEKTRYLAPLRRSVRRQFSAQVHPIDSHSFGEDAEGPDGEPSLGDQIREIHANTLPGVTRPEEGEERIPPSTATFARPADTSRARQSLLDNYEQYNQHYEEERERDRYEDYLDEKEDEDMPNAFDLGWRNNLRHVFGPTWWLCWLPVCNTLGDGWTWEANPDWLAARSEVDRRREARLARATGQLQHTHVDGAHPGNHPPPQRLGMTLPQRMAHDARVWGRSHGAGGTPMQTLRRNISPKPEASPSPTKHKAADGAVNQPATANWNDLPEDMVRSSTRRAPVPHSRSSGRLQGADRWESWDDHGG